MKKDRLYGNVKWVILNEVDLAKGRNNKKRVCYQQQKKKQQGHPVKFRRNSMFKKNVPY